MKNLALLSGVLCMFGGVLIALPASAQEVVVTDADTDYEEVFMPQLFSTSVTIDDDELPQDEPNIQQVDFLKLPELTSLEERIDRLIHGILTTIPPEYDHYGHEIRRYMADVGNPKIYQDGEDEFLIQRIKNVRKAAVIVKYWKEYLLSEIDDIEKEIEKENAGILFSTKTAFKQNQTTVKTFLLSLNAWVDANEKLLMNVFDNPGIYEVYYPEIIFVKPIKRVDYYNAASLQSQKLKDIRAYPPFAMMVY